MYKYSMYTMYVHAVLHVHLPCMYYYMYVHCILEMDRDINIYISVNNIPHIVIRLTIIYTQKCTCSGTSDKGQSFKDTMYYANKTNYSIKDKFSSSK